MTLILTPLSLWKLLLLWLILCSVATQHVTSLAPALASLGFIDLFSTIDSLFFWSQKVYPPVFFFHFTPTSSSLGWHISWHYMLAPLHSRRPPWTSLRALFKPLLLQGPRPSASWNSLSRPPPLSRAPGPPPCLACNPPLYERPPLDQAN